MRKAWRIIAVMLILVLTLGVMPLTVLAQDEPTPSETVPLTIYTNYPHQVIGIEDSVSLDLTIQASEAQVVTLEATDVPEGWVATFRGGGRIIESVYVQPDREALVDLRLEPPAGIEPGEYGFTVVAQSETEEAEFQVQLTVQEKLPPSLSMSTELPTLTGTPGTTFRWDVTLENEGDENLDVSLSAEATPGFLVTFQTGGNDVTSLPLNAGETKQISVSANPRSDVQAGDYAFAITAQGGGAEASLALQAEVGGQPELTVTAPDGRLSGQAYAGSETPVQIIVRNDGTAPAVDVAMSASNPSGWNVTFAPGEIDQLDAGQEIEVTANVQPAEQAVAGDYMATFTARGADGASGSAEFRITVLTSTLWGITGVALIAVAVGVVGLAVSRFGRR